MALKKPLTATAMALAVLGGSMAAPALAQEATEAPLEAPAEAPLEAPAEAPLEAPSEAPTFSQEQLESFVAAALEVSGIQQQAAASLVETEDQAAQDVVLQEANEAMIAAIEAEPGITVPEYIAIAEAAEADPTLRAQLEEMIIAAQQQ